MHAIPNKQIVKITSELLDDYQAADYVNFLFDLQNSLIQYGHTASMTKKGCMDFSGKFATLKAFFEDLYAMQKTK